MNFVRITERFDSLRPFRRIKIRLVVERDGLRIEINIDFLDLRIFAADVLDELRAAFAVDAGDGDGGIHT